ncbi:40S ribosomal protein S26-like [Trichosurus vulpecula]|uniref:40S ribosomal protein S26-like n=1 Tax=Trichosurus vulpecula TaxID=9337 RepID=UPI00186AE9B9|nr:40S ribosomal protein S26-like [Trichosurus vulpecula]
MTKRRRNNGSAKKGRGQVQPSCRTHRTRWVPKDKAIEKLVIRNVVEAWPSGTTPSRRLRLLRAARAVCETTLLREGRRPQQGREESLPGGTEGSHAPTRFRPSGAAPGWPSKAM